MSERLAFSCENCGGPFLAEHTIYGIAVVVRYCVQGCDELDIVLAKRARNVEEVAGSDETHDRALAAKETDPSELKRKVSRIACNRDQLDAEDEFVDNNLRMRP